MRITILAGLALVITGSNFTGANPAFAEDDSEEIICWEKKEYPDKIFCDFVKDLKIECKYTDPRGLTSPCKDIAKFDPPGFEPQLTVKPSRKPQTKLKPKKQDQPKSGKRKPSTVLGALPKPPNSTTRASGLRIPTRRNRQPAAGARLPFATARPAAPGLPGGVTAVPRRR